MNINRSYRFLEEHDFVIIDRALVEEQINDLPLVPLIPSGMTADQHLLPALLPLKQLTPSRRFELLDDFEEQVRCGMTPIFSSILDSDATLSCLADHLKKHLILRQSDGRKVLFRYFDSRVFCQLAWMLDRSNINRIIGPVSQWHYLYEDVFHTIKYDSKDGHDRSQSSVKFDADEWKRVSRISQINQLLGRLSRGTVADLETTSRQIYELLERAERHYGLTEADDQSEFAMRGMTIDPHFGKHPIVSQVFPKLKDDECSFRDAMSVIDQAQWQQIAEQMRTLTRIPA